MNKIGRIALISVAALSVAACQQVDPGHVGIEVNRYGSGAGVSGKSLGVGTYFMTPGRDIYEYPIFTNNYTWSASGEDGSPEGEHFTFQDRSGLSLSADVAVAYRVDPGKAPVLFQKYRMEMEGIVAGALRNAVRSVISEEASNMSVEQIYGPGKTAMISKVQQRVAQQFTPVGLVVEQVYWASGIRVPENVMQQIAAKTANEQQALAAKANVETVRANGDALVAEATAKAEATQIEAAALAANPVILQQRAVEKWDGSMPQYLSGDGPLPFIGSAVR